MPGWMGYGPPPTQPAMGSFGPTSEARSGAAHFGAMPPPVSGPASESRSGPGHFGAAPPAPPGEGYGPGFGEQYGQSHMGAYDQPTMIEQFAQQQMNGNNPYYDRLRQQADAQLNQQMAARGHYNSGGALAALGNADAALYADQFANMGNLVGQASNMGLNRQQAGFQQASGIQGLQQNRLGQQFNEGAQIANLGAGLYGGFYGQGGQQSGDAAMAGINAGANAAALSAQGQQARQNVGLDLLKTIGAGGL